MLIEAQRRLRVSRHSPEGATADGVRGIERYGEPRGNPDYFGISPGLRGDRELSPSLRNIPRS